MLGGHDESAAEVAELVLGQSRLVAALELLLTVLRDDVLPARRARAMGALAHFRGERATSALLDVAALVAREFGDARG